MFYSMACPPSVFSPNVPHTSLCLFMNNKKSGTFPPNSPAASLGYQNLLIKWKATHTTPTNSARFKTAPITTPAILRPNKLLIFIFIHLSKTGLLIARILLSPSILAINRIDKVVICFVYFIFCIFSPTAIGSFQHSF